jgi:hypothetical protein
VGFQADNSFRRNVRYLSIFARPKDTEPLFQPYRHGSLYPICTNASVGRDRLLHYTSLPQNMINVDQIKYWMNVCQTQHPWHCIRLPWVQMDTADLRMIDVNERRIIKVDGLVEYFALSYCWGTESQARPYLTLTCDTEARLSRPGGLSASQSLPATIQDAIDLTRMLDCRYLWVDALCIV